VHQVGDKKVALNQSNTTHVYFSSIGYPYMSATCFDLYLGHPQVCQYKILTKECVMRSVISSYARFLC
jgi:hypothetical protein